MAEVLEYNDIYDEHRNLTGRVHLRGTQWGAGEYGLGVSVWVYDGAGKILMTRRAPEKTFAGTWENTGGGVQAGEDSLTAIVRELREETGILAEPSEFELLDTGMDGNSFFDHYCLKRKIRLEDVVLLPGETDAVRWADFDEIHRMIESGEICHVIAQEFLRNEQELRRRQII